MNLAVNARDAMPKGGTLTLRTAPVVLTAGAPDEVEEVRPGPYVLVTVTDTGCGMDAHTRARLFEPFFTTKGPGKGTGLGLATVYGIVKQSGGHIRVRSEPGEGSSFEVYLPALDDVPAAGAAPTGRPDLPRGTETVLVVEDEEAVRTLTRAALRQLGYTVLEAAGGPAALCLAERHTGRIDLLLTDVVMPEMGGGELATRLRAMRPETRVLYLTGYTDDAVLRHGVSDAEVPLLTKPYTIAALARKVRAVLDGGR
ncbi:MAG: response regulator [Gemmataceae bacterium]